MKEKKNKKKKKIKKNFIYVSNFDSKFQYSFKKNGLKPLKIKKFDPIFKKYSFFYEKK